MTNDEMHDMAYLAQDIIDEGIEVSLRKGDMSKVFVAVIAANIATVFIVSGLASWIKKQNFYKPTGNTSSN